MKFAIPARGVRAMRSRLSNWFSRNQRDLPWRRNSDPYQVWVSEIMLQQTRVAAVVPYFERFVTQFPDVHSLADAAPEAVLRHWAGLGYYSRARNLHQAARQLVDEHGGRFPSTREAALRLPGVGEYTSAAVLSIAYQQPFAVLDGNVARVVARLGAVRGNLREPKNWNALQATAQMLLDARRPGDWNQAMMELGATVCLPRAPLCSICPLCKSCQANLQGLTGQIPEKRKKRDNEDVSLAAAVLLDPRQRTLLIRQADDKGALFSRMWQFPVLQTREDPQAELARYLREEFGCRTRLPLVALKTARHTVTYRRIRLIPFLIRVPRLPRVAGGQTPRLSELQQLAISNATRKIAGAAIESVS
jgi:A/G-specific adenine glycosylase